MNLKELNIKNKLIRQEIIRNINSFNKLRDERNNVNTLVRETKKKREACVNTIKIIINEIKELNKEKNNISADNIHFLKNLITRKEWFFQINVLPIKKEEALMKEIKELNKKLKEAKQSGKVMLRIRKLVNELENKRKLHNKLHNEVMEKAKESNEVSERMKVVQKQIKDLKKEGVLVSAELKKKLFEKDNSSNIYFKSSAEKKKREENIMEQKQDELLAKLKEKKKLTSEDLIVLQK